MAAVQKDGDTMEIVRAVHEKRPVPEIDFSLHTMEDGSQVSTQERVCKGNERSDEFGVVDTNDLFKRFKRLRIIRLQKNNYNLPTTAASPIFNF